MRRLQQFGVSAAAAERGVRVVERALAEDGPLTRLELAERVRRSRIGSEGALHVVILASLRGHVVRGPVIGKQHAYAHPHDWLGPPPRVDRDAALAELARRYLAGHSPATDRDLAYWAGITLGNARAGLRAIGGELRERPDARVELRGRRLATTVPPPRLLGAFDPVLHGWASREHVLGRYEASIVSGGLFRPFALVAGRAAGVLGMACRRCRAPALEAADACRAGSSGHGGRGHSPVFRRARKKRPLTPVL